MHRAAAVYADGERQLLFVPAEQQRCNRIAGKQFVAMMSDAFPSPPGSQAVGMRQCKRAAARLPYSLLWVRHLALKHFRVIGRHVEITGH